MRRLVGGRAKASLPPPTALGLPDRFLRWRPHQAEAVLAMLQPSPRVHLLTAPVGAGKSAIAVALAKLLDRRVAILTSTKGLQTQYMLELGEAGLLDLRGAANYPCRALDKGEEHHGFYSGRPGNCAEGPCHYGLPCTYRNQGCLYYDQIKKVKRHPVSVINYSMWFAMYEYSDGLGEWGAVICDEAHQAPDELSAFMETKLSMGELRDYEWWPGEGEMEAGQWVEWAEDVVARGTRLVAKLDPVEDYKKIRELKKTLRKVGRITGLDQNWVHWAGTGWGDVQEPEHNFAPLWPAAYKEVLFRNAPRVVLASATATPKTAQLLGLGPSDFKVHETPHTFPVDNRLVTVLSGKYGYGADGKGYVPQVKYNWSWEDQMQWVARIDEIIGGRLDRKGIVHTGSYGRAKLLRERSKFARLMWVPWSGNTQEKVDGFKAAQAPAILVSPALTTGWDFPADHCRYQIIAKVPFPDSSDPLTKARTKADPEYASHLAMTQIVQASGRAVRSADDWAETFIVDRQADWFLQKARHLAPEWFLDQLVWAYEVPEPRRLG